VTPLPPSSTWADTTRPRPTAAGRRTSGVTARPANSIPPGGRTGLPCHWAGRQDTADSASWRARERWYSALVISSSSSTGAAASTALVSSASAPTVDTGAACPASTALCGNGIARLPHRLSGSSGSCGTPAQSVADLASRVGAAPQRLTQPGRGRVAGQLPGGDQPPSTVYQ